MCGRKKSSPPVVSDISEWNHENPVEWCKDVLTKFEKHTSLDSMTDNNIDNPLEHAFKLSGEIRNFKEKNTEIRSELKDLIKKTKKFTVDLLDACEDHHDVGAVLNFGENDENHKEKLVKTLKDAVAARHKEVLCVCDKLRLFL